MDLDVTNSPRYQTTPLALRLVPPNLHRLLTPLVGRGSFRQEIPQVRTNGWRDMGLENLLRPGPALYARAGLASLLRSPARILKG